MKDIKECVAPTIGAGAGPVTPMNTIGMGDVNPETGGDVLVSKNKKKNKKHIKDYIKEHLIKQHITNINNKEKIFDLYKDKETEYASIYVDTMDDVDYILNLNNWEKPQIIRSTIENNMRDSYCVLLWPFKKNGKDTIVSIPIPSEDYFISHYKFAGNIRPNNFTFKFWIENELIY